MLPEIVALPRLRIAVEPLDPVRVYANLIVPDRKRLIILAVDRRIQAVG